MKRIYACLGIVAALLAVAFYSSFRVQMFAEDISGDIDLAMEAIREDDLTGARQALAARPQVNAALLADEYPNDFARIIGLHTYSQSPHRDYDIQLTGNWVERGGFRFEDFVLTRRREEENGNH